MAPERRARRSRKTTKTEPYNSSERLALLSRHKAPPSLHAPATKDFIAKVKKSWNRYCQTIPVCPDTALGSCNTDCRYFKGYLEWYIVTSNVKSFSTLEVQWKYLRLVYSERTQCYLDKRIGDEIRSYLHNNLRIEQELTLLGRSKPLAKATDLFVLLHYHWALDTSILRHERYRIQLPLILMLMAFTASRPGALIESNCRRGTNESLKYKDVSLRILPCDGARQIVIVMELTSWIMKGRGRKQEPVIFMLHERDDCLAFDPIILFLALAFTDNAFKSEDIKKPADLYGLVVPSYVDSIQLQWRESILETPIFREAGPQGRSISETEAFSYGILQALLKNLGENAGFEEPLKPYNFRRAAASVIDPIATVSQRTQALGHTAYETYDKYYRSRRVNLDIQSAFLGTPSRSDLLDAIGKMGLRRHPQAPKSLTKVEKKTAIGQNKELQSLQNEADDLRNRLLRNHKRLKIAKANDTDLYQEYEALQKDIKSEKMACERDAMTAKRQYFFDNINEVEIAKQLRTMEPHSDTDSSSQSHALNMAFQERSDIARFFFGSIDVADRRIKWSDQQPATPDIRIRVLGKLISLCQASEGILNFVEPLKVPSIDFQFLRKPDDIIPDNQACEISQQPLIPAMCPSFQCLFCLGDTKLAERARFRGWSRSDSLRRHVSTQHLKHLGTSAKIVCPHPACCGTLLESQDHFKCHAAKVHNVYY